MVGNRDLSDGIAAFPQVDGNFRLDVIAVSVQVEAAKQACINKLVTGFHVTQPTAVEQICKYREGMVTNLANERLADKVADTINCRPAVVKITRE